MGKPHSPSYFGRIAVVATLLSSACVTFPVHAQSGAVGTSMGGQDQQSIDKAFRALDLNGDGVVSRREVDEIMELARKFNAADINGNGELSLSEFSAFEEGTNRERPYGTGPAPGTLPSGTLAQSQLFEALDTDHDGTISRKEAENYPALSRNFDRADTNGDGTISRSEFAEFQFGQEYGRPVLNPRANLGPGPHEGP